MDNRSVKEPGTLDQVAVALSGQCLVHCLMLPVAIAILPFLAEIDEGHLHVQMLFVVLPVSGIALWLGYRRHGDRRIIIAGAAGLILLVIGGTVAHNVYGLIADRSLTIMGSLVLAITHYRNSQQSRNCARLRI